MNNNMNKKVRVCVMNYTTSFTLFSFVIFIHKFSHSLMFVLEKMNSVIEFHVEFDFEGIMSSLFLTGI